MSHAIPRISAAALLGAEGEASRREAEDAAAEAAAGPGFMSLAGADAALGLDPKAVVEVISKGAAQSWQMDNRYETMLEGRFDFGFAVEWMRKDLALALDEARRNGAHLPVAALVDQFYAEVQAMGGGRWDTSALIARLRHAGD